MRKVIPYATVCKNRLLNMVRSSCIMSEEKLVAISMSYNLF